ncbi:MAG: VOC family protein [Chloroflexi bacterium]|nr:VOC family protein [Chloroflexota bacterium]MCL5109129.1 VOC family protein [Chloroflexota bacterium]
MAEQPSFRLNKIAHVCLVVKDIDKSMAAYYRDFGVGPWRLVTYGSADCAEGSTYRGQPGNFRMRFALTDVGGLTLEMVQTLQGPTIYDDHLKKCGESVHHMGIIVDELDKAVAEFAAMGFKPIMTARGWGKSHDGHFAYMGTEDALGVVYELVKMPTVRFDPDGFYPPQ